MFHLYQRIKIDFITFLLPTFKIKTQKTQTDSYTRKRKNKPTSGCVSKGVISTSCKQEFQPLRKYVGKTRCDNKQHGKSDSLKQSATEPADRRLQCSPIILVINITAIVTVTHKMKNRWGMESYSYFRVYLLVECPRHMKELVWKVIGKIFHIDYRVFSKISELRTTQIQNSVRNK